MTEPRPPQPHRSRLTPFANRPLVVGVVPKQSPLVAVTAASLAKATNAPALYFAYVDVSRYTAMEHPDGSVDHLPINPDTADDSWETVQEALIDQVSAAMLGEDVPWEFRYLAGRVDRSLTHLARSVDATGFVVGTRSGSQHRLSDFINGSVATQLSYRQHRPVLVVPLRVVDWRGRAPWE